MRRHTINIAWILVFVLLHACQSDGEKASEAAEEKIGFYENHKAFKSFTKHFADSIDDCFKSDFDGTVLVYKQGKLFKRAYGKIDLRNSSKMRVDDLFQLASVSKTITAVALMQLLEKGQIQLEDTLQKFLPEFPYNGITIRQLLSHRSGLSNYMYETEYYWKDSNRYMQNKDLLTFIQTQKPRPYNYPNACFSYCNTNYALLPLIIEKVSGKAFHDYVFEYIFKPAGMRQTFFLGHKPNYIHSRVLIGRYDQYEYNTPYYSDAILGDKSVYSNVEDMLMFHLALSEGRLLKPSTMALMFTPSFPYYPNGMSYGLGFRLNKMPSGLWQYHNGWWRGFWTAFWNRFDKQICVVVLTNSKHSSHINKRALAELVYTGQ